MDAELDELLAFADRGMAVAWHAARRPTTPALITPTETITYAELNGRANRLARALRRRGLQRGDAVALLCSNRAEFVEILLATQRTGLRLTTVNWHLTADEAGYIVDDCEARAFVAEARFADVARGAADAAPRVTVRLAVAGSIDGFEEYDAAVAAEPGEDLADPVLGSQMLYTSGTTGRPKGVFRDEASLATAVTLARAAYRDENVHLLTGPLYHAAPLLFSLNAPLVAGVTVVVMPAWDPEEALRLIDRHRVSHTHMVPTMFHQLLTLPDDVRDRYDVSSLHNVLHGAAPCPVVVKQRLIEWWGPVVNEYYAATEGLGTWVDARTWLRKPGTVGKPVPDDQVVVGDDEGNRMPPGEVGLVWFKASEVPFEYFKDRAKTDSSYRENHFTLGDMGYVDDDGFLFLTDRSANLIISGGVNIYPAEIDAVLLEHPAVADAAVIGVPNPEWGEDVLAVIEPRPGVAPTDDLAGELVGFCRDRLAHYKCPRRVEFVDRLPRQDNGKIYKRVLRDRYRERAST
ncbi:MAG TPA: AMP-binding protein [Acidimicrobiia bacterium]|nr:AMP-binding protein [Acidimicrobiia bacterium]